MTDTQHTPAPWSNDLADHPSMRDRHNIIGEDKDGNQFVIAQVSEHVLNGNWKANARLIAAAPELYEAALWAKEHVDNPKALEVIEEALAKAE